MDEIYHKNQKQSDDDGQIKCNVVSNPNNFLNSVILRDKNNLNDPEPELTAKNLETLQKERNNLKQSVMLRGNKDYY